MRSLIKYSIVTYIVLAFLFIYQLNLAISAKNILEKKVKGISTQIKDLESYQEEISSFNSNY